MFEESYAVWFTYVPWGKVSKMSAFSNNWFKEGFANYKLCVSIYAMKIMGEKTAVFVPIAVPWACPDSARY